MPKISIHVGDCRRILPGLAVASADCLVTSPPYFRRRVYLPEGHPDGAAEMGREATPDEYLEALVSALSLARTVLHPRGVAWVNIGDQYARAPISVRGIRLKAKDLMMLPAHLAMALQSDGWFLRSDICWQKPNCTPEAVRDRPVCSHESVLMVSRSASYDYDAAAVREPAVMRPQRRLTKRSYGDASVPKTKRFGSSYFNPDVARQDSPDGLRHMRDVMTVATAPFKGLHFAPFPPALVRPLILAGCRPGGTVLDPFGGSGVTASVAYSLGRDTVMCELNGEYARIARLRCVAAGVSPEDIEITEHARLAQ